MEWSVQKNPSRETASDGEIVKKKRSPSAGETWASKKFQTMYKEWNDFENDGLIFCFWLIHTIIPPAKHGLVRNSGLTSIEGVDRSKFVTIIVIHQKTYCDCFSWQLPLVCYNFIF